MHEAVFVKAYPFARRAAEVRSAVARSRNDFTIVDREDLEQEAMVGLWRALPRFDSSRASLRTFVERVVYSKMASAMRSYRALSRTVPGEAPHLPKAGEPSAASDARVDVARVLVKLSAADRRLAALLVDHTPTEVSRILGIARSTVYEGIRRIRIAFVAAGLGPSEQRPQ